MIKEKEYIKCPFCGKPMEVHRHYYTVGFDPEYAYDEFEYLSCRCKECKVSFKSEYCYPDKNELYDLDNWKIPKNKKITITKKQSACIFGICSTLDIIPDPCFTIELAKNWISKYIQESKDKLADNLHYDDIRDILSKYGYGSCQKNFREHYDYRNMKNITTKYFDKYKNAYQSLEYKKDTKKIYRAIWIENDNFNLKLEGYNIPSIKNLELEILKDMELEYQKINSEVAKLKIYGNDDVDKDLNEKRELRQKYEGYSDFEEECPYDLGELC